MAKVHNADIVEGDDPHIAKDMSCNQIHKTLGNGISTEDGKKNLKTYGLNSTTIPQKSFLGIVFGEIFTPAYIFQLFSIILWAFWNDYPIYAGILGGFSIVTLIVKFIKVHSDYQRLTQAASHETDIKVYRLSSEDGKKGAQHCKVLNSKFLVPGDLIEVQSNQVLPCDAILINGTCVTNESAITGNSSPAIKEQLPASDDLFDANKCPQNVILSGTEVLEVRKQNENTPVLAIVIRTGFSTIKGRLIKANLKPRNKGAGFWNASYVYIAALVVLAIVTFAFSLHFLIDQGKDAGYIARKSMDMITIALPGALPTYMAIGGLISVLRLKRKNILTRGIQRMNIAGAVQVMCFEKSGTLAKNTLDFHGVRVVGKLGSKETLLPLINENIHGHLNTSQEKNQTTHMLELMATCHGLTRVGGMVAGTPLDSKMFEAVGWRMTDATPTVNNEPAVCAVCPPVRGATGYYKPISAVNVVKRFNSTTETTTVVVKDPVEGKQRVYVKGSSETIISLCRQDTIPEDLTASLAYYEQNGLKVIACGTRPVDQEINIYSKVDQASLEKDLEFLGLLVFDNKLNDSSSSIVRQLKQANIKSVMLTGDGVLNAIYAARNCGIVDRYQKVMLGTLQGDEGFKRLTWRRVDPVEQEETYNENDPLTKGNDNNIEIRRGEDALPEEDLGGVVSKESNIAIAMTGEAFAYFCVAPDVDATLRDAVLKKSRVFGDMRPNDKAFVIQNLQKQGLIVGMCGSGVEDCPALNVANVGISLNQGESIPAALISSKSNNITVVDTILREGRAILTNHIQAFRFLCMYAFIQTFSAIYAYSRETVISEASFFYQDIFPVLIPAITVFFTSPTDKLSKKRPEGLLSPAFVLGMLGQCLFHAISQFLGVVFLRNQFWYQTPNQMRVAAQERTCDEFAEYADYDATVLFLIGNIQYFGAICAFSIGRPFKKSWFNILYVFFVGYTGLMSLIIMLVRMPAVIDVLDIADFEVKQSFRWVIFACAAIDVFVTIAWEKLVVPVIVLIFSRPSKV